MNANITSLATALKVESLHKKAGITRETIERCKTCKIKSILDISLKFVETAAMYNLNIANMSNKWEKNDL